MHNTGQALFPDREGRPLLMLLRKGNGSLLKMPEFSRVVPTSSKTFI